MAADGGIGDGGHEGAGVAEDSLHPAYGIRSAGQEGRADRRHSAKGHEAEIDEVLDRRSVNAVRSGPVRGLRSGRRASRHRRRPDGCADLGLFENVRRSVGELHLDDDTPAILDRHPSPLWVDQRRRRRACRYQDSIGRDQRAGDHDATDPIAPNIQCRRASEPDLHAATFGERRVGVRRGAGLDRKADPHPASPHSGRDRRLYPLEFSAGDHLPFEFGKSLGQ